MIFGVIKKRTAAIKIVSIIMVLCLLNAVIPSEASTFVNDPLSTAASNKLSSPFSFDNFQIPFSSGSIEARHKADSGKYVIHIQDAHCNYDAQIRIAELLEFIRNKYNIVDINLEGGSGPYALDIFTSIYEKNIRKTVADHFLGTGELSGAEYYAINDPGRSVLWGVEDTELYSKNLNVYRDFQKDRPKVEAYISFIRKKLQETVPVVLTGEAADIYERTEAYESGKITFHEYIAFLYSRLKASGVAMDDEYPNVTELFTTGNDGSRINFKKAEDQRELILEALRAVLSKYEKKSFAGKVIAYSRKLISDAEFHEYILKMAKRAGIDPVKVKAFGEYTAYINAFEKIDYSELMKEMTDGSCVLKSIYFTEPEQRDLDKMLSNLKIFNDMTRLSLTRPGYDRFRSENFYCSINVFRAFIQKHCELSDSEMSYLNSFNEIDRLIAKNADFYGYSFERDRAFIHNLKYSVSGEGEAAVLVTGGFHSENIFELLRENNISYISIVPKFNNSDKYKNFYYDLLSGRTPGEQVSFVPGAARYSNIAIASKLAPILGGYIWKESGIEAFDAAVIIQEILVRGGDSESYEIVNDFKSPDFSSVLDENKNPVIFGEENMPGGVISLKRVMGEAITRKTVKQTGSPGVRDYLINLSKDQLNGLGAMRELHGRRFIVDDEGFVMTLESQQSRYPFKLSLRRNIDGKEVGYKEFSIDRKGPYRKILFKNTEGDLEYSDEYEGCVNGGMLEVVETVEGTRYRGRDLGRLLMSNFGKAIPAGYVYETEIGHRQTLIDMFDGKAFAGTKLGEIMREWEVIRLEFVDGRGEYYEDLDHMGFSNQDEFLDKGKIYGTFIPKRSELENSVFQWPAEDPENSGLVDTVWTEARMKKTRETVPVQMSLFDDLSGYDQISGSAGRDFVADLKILMDIKDISLENLNVYIRKQNPSAVKYVTTPIISRKQGETFEDAAKKAVSEIRRAMLRDHIEYLNRRAGLIPGKMIECENIDATKKYFRYEGVDLNNGLMVSLPGSAAGEVFLYRLSELKSVKPSARFRDRFIGKRVIGFDLVYQDKKFVCRDALGREREPVELEKIRYTTEDLEDDIRKLSLGPAQRKTLEEIAELLKISIPEFYSYETLIEDLFGFSESYRKDDVYPHGVVSVWKGILENERLRAVGLFHEIGHYLLEKKLLEIKIQGSELVLSSRGKPVGIPVRIRDPHSFRQIVKAYIEPEYFYHYCLRALQIELFGSADLELSAFIYEQNRNSDIIPGRKLYETDFMREFGPEGENVVKFASGGRALIGDIARHVKYQAQRDNGRVTEKHSLYLKSGEELSFFLKRPDEKYVLAFRPDSRYFAAEQKASNKAAQAGIGVFSELFYTEERVPFLILLPASGQRLRVRHLTGKGSNVPENILYALGKLHALGITHGDLTYLMLDDEYGPDCINFDHVYADKNGSIQFIDLGEAGRRGEAADDTDIFIAERNEVIESINNLVVLETAALVESYERGKRGEKARQLSLSRYERARDVIYDIFSERAKAAIGDLRQKNLDIIVMPGSENHISRQEEISSKIRRKLAKDYGQETVSLKYIYSGKWRESIKDIMNNKVRKEFTRGADKDPRILLYLPVDPDEIRNIYTENGLLYDVRDLREYITVIAEENIPENGVIDEVMHVVLAKALLNYERFRKKYYGEGSYYSEEALTRLENFLKVFVEDPGDIDIGSDPEIINKIIDGFMSLKIKHIDIEDISRWKDQQDAVLMSL